MKVTRINEIIKSIKHYRVLAKIKNKCMYVNKSLLFI